MRRIGSTIHGSYAPIYLHDEGSREGASSRYESSRRYLAVVLSRREDRRARLERRREELAAARDGGRGHELSGRSVSRERDFDRLSAAGAAPRRDQDGSRQRRGGGRADQEAARAVRRG